MSLGIALGLGTAAYFALKPKERTRTQAEIDAISREVDSKLSRIEKDAVIAAHTSGDTFVDLGALDESLITFDDEPAPPPVSRIAIPVNPARQVTAVREGASGSTSTTADQSARFGVLLARSGGAF